MTVKNKYAKGRRFEYKVKKLLEEKGWVVLRCAGSKPFDLVALKKGQPTLFIECKTTRYIPKSQEERLKELAEKADAKPVFVGKYEWDFVQRAIVNKELDNE